MAENDIAAPVEQTKGGDKILAESSEAVSVKALDELGSKKDSPSDKEDLVTENKDKVDNASIQDITLNTDGSDTTLFKDGHPDKLKSETNWDLGKGGTRSEKKYEGREDGLKSQTVTDATGEKVVANEYEPGKGKDGVLKESTRSTADKTVTERTFDPDLHKDGVKSETIELKDKTRTSTQVFKDDSRVETVTGPDGKITSTKRFNAQGELIPDEKPAGEKAVDKDAPAATEELPEGVESVNEGRDGTKTTVFKDGHHKDGLKTRVEKEIPDEAPSPAGMKTEESYVNNPDGLTKKTTFEPKGGGARTTTSEFEGNPKGLTREKVTSEGDLTTTERTFDPDKSGGIKGEKVEVNAKDGTEKTTQINGDDTSVETIKKDGEIQSVRKLDAQGQEIKEAAPDQVDEKLPDDVASRETLGDGSVKTTYKEPYKDGLKSKIETDVKDGAQGKLTQEEYAGRADGLNKKTTFESADGNKKSVTSEFDPEKSGGVKEERVETDAAARTEKTTKTMKDGSSVETLNKDGEEVSKTAFDANGESRTTLKDGSIETKYRDGHPSGLKSKLERNIPGEGTHTTEEYAAGRPDGLKKQSSFAGGDGTKSTTREYEGNPDGLTKESVTAKGDKTITEKTYDPEKSAGGIKSETIEADSKEKTEKITQKMKDGSSTETLKKDGKVESTKKFDKEGKEIKEDPKKEEKDPKQEQLDKFKADMENIKLPAIKKGQGPYHALKAAQEAGLIPKMSHKETLAEARRIRDRDFKDREKKHYKVGEQPKLSKEFIDKAVEAKAKELGIKPGEKSPKETEPPPKKPETGEEVGKETAEPKKAVSELPLENKGNASKEFADKVQKTLDELPASARKALKDAGIKFVTGEKVTTIEPDLKGKDVPGQPKGTSWDRSGGFFHPQSKTVVFPEQQMNAEGKMEKTPDSSIGNVIGDAVDSSLGISKDQGFEDALKKDIEKMPAEMGERMAKVFANPELMQRSKGQVFKALFSAMYGPVKDSDAAKRGLQNWSNAAEFIRNKLK